MLGELIAYLERGRAGTGGFNDMGDRWVAVRDGARAKTLRATDAGVTEIAARWEQLIEFLALCLTPGSESTGGGQLAPRSSTFPAGSMCTAARWWSPASSTPRSACPDAVGPLEIEADLRTRQLGPTSVRPSKRRGKANPRRASPGCFDNSMTRRTSSASRCITRTSEKRSAGYSVTMSG